MGDAIASLDMTVAEIAAEVARGVRIGRDEARWLCKNASDEALRSLAGSVRGGFHALGSCTYMVMRIINYPNVCVAQCDYCAFYRLPGQDGGYVLSHEQVFAKLDKLLALGGDLAGFNGGFNPHLPLDYYCDLFAAIRPRETQLRCRSRALQSRRRPLDHWRRVGDSDRGFPPPPQQVQVHRGRLL